MSKNRGCAVCKVQIHPERAEGLPRTRLCTRHAFEIEPLGGEFTISSEVERTSKVGSLKRNYGGVMVVLRRNEKALARLKERYKGRRPR